MTVLLKNYNFLETESKWQDYWKKKEVYKWEENTSREETYSIDTPPPTVSGQLHMGHIYSYTQADFIARFQRMNGKNVFYPIGFDDNGLPTERLVEKKKNIKAVNTDRAEFIKICQEIVDEEEEKFEKLFTSVALSVDWNLKYQSISPLSSHLSQLSFLDLVNKEEIYRAEQPILWDPVDQTALAQADIEDKEKESAMHDIIFSSTSGEQLIIATTRPELLPACVAVLYHPDDERYKQLSGSFAISPLFKVKVPLIADDQVLPDKGTGLVMCCTFGDTTDIDWWKKHKLLLRLILDKRGRIKPISFDENCEDPTQANSNFEQLIGLKVNEARAKILELLNNENLILKSVAITHTVKCAERSGAPLEIITAPQWFVKTISHKEELLERSKELNWHPASMKIRLDNWINSINWDWCISRQRFFGVPFPVWYSKREGEEGKAIFASSDQLPVNPLVDLPKGYSRDEVIADPDVMDTWATSSVSPQLASHAITEALSVNYERHAKLFPFDLRPQAHEILRTWAFYTILKSHLHENSLPWTNIMISGWCLAEDRTKMSKSKGTAISPEKLLEQHGSDAVRYWASTSRLGADTAISDDNIKNGKKLVNKLWNAAKFASQHFAKLEGNIKPLAELLEQKAIYCQADLWILNKLQKTITQATEQFKNYEYSLACSAVEQFFWQDFCDNYLEISKARCYNEPGADNAGQLSGIYTLYYTLKTILELFAPIVPHITEELYQAIYSQGHSIHIKGNWPKWDEINLPNDVSQGEQIVTALNLVRKAKAAKSLSIKAPIETMYLTEANFELSYDAQTDLKNVTNTTNLIMAENLSEGEIIEEGTGVELSLVFS